MNPKTTTAVFSFSAFIALIALHGKAFFEAFGALPTVLQNFSKLMPLGTGSFFLSLAMAGVAWHLVHRCHSASRRRASNARSFGADTLSLFVGVGAMLLQTGIAHTAPGTARASAIYSVMLGILAGFLAPFIMKGAMALYDRLLKTKVTP